MYKREKMSADGRTYFVFVPKNIEIKNEKVLLIYEREIWLSQPTSYFHISKIPWKESLKILASKGLITSTNTRSSRWISKISNYYIKYITFLSIKLYIYSIVKMFYSLFHALAIFRYIVWLLDQMVPMRCSVPKQNVFNINQ